MGKNFTVDASLLMFKAKKFVKQLKLDEPKIVKDEAGMLAQSFASITPPFASFSKPKLNYGTKKDIKKGERATLIGLNKSLRRIGNVNAWSDTKMKAAIRSGDVAYIENRLKHMKGSNKHNLRVQKYSDAARNKQRNNRGRVNRGTIPIVMIRDEDVQAGLDRAIARVGMAKAAFAKAAVLLGRKKPIALIVRHFSKVRASFSISKNPSIVRFSVTTHGDSEAYRRRKQVERFRIVALVKRLEKMVRADAKKAGFKTR